ncbi:protein LURP-one-related 2-like [Pyrus ussuriensis x Pyrus communis]|uniref:Protein LURP-one-related 2-like n=1 Tax=Pyrus ussuriensis x Pyrus communis TaxID=2448454 RepID=A0A5N5FZP8_9ROSA|nr:protein LURP-one-related 2-like [Pyrus ussuriensis x Pyrus communis]
MAKVHPFIIANGNSRVDASCSSTTTTSSLCTTKYLTSKRETFTIWMKSLVMQGNGCTAFDANGEVVYRIDNYDNKHSNEVYLMDLRGKLLFTVCEKKMCGFRSWKGYESNHNIGANKPMFQVRKSCRFVHGSKVSLYKVTMRSVSDCYRLEGSNGKSSSAFIVRDNNGGIIAEAKQKQSSSGVVLGDDVMTLFVEAHVDHSFIMALVTVYGLIRHQI